MDEAALNQVALNHDADAAAPMPGADEQPSALLSRLRLIEDQPLESRAEALAQLQSELRAQLEAGDAARPHA